MIGCNDRRRRQSGYTLVELLVVLAILGLLVAIAAPQLIKYLGSANPTQRRSRSKSSAAC